jgi:AsmA protein
MQATELRAELRAAGGRLEIAPLGASLYQGQLAGALTVDARAVPRIGVRQTLTGVQLGPMLKDALGRDSLEGRGDVGLSVSAQGATLAALKRALDGDARIALRDGAVRGINVAQVIRSAKAKLGGGSGEQTGAGSRAEKTDFSEMTASFKIDRGVARNQDLLAKSPLLRITGEGDIDLAAQRIDYVVKATVVTTLQGQGGPELQALSGQTVPVRLSGPFDAIGWRIDFAAMAKDAVKQKIESRKDEAKEKLRDKLGGALKGLFGK